MPANDGKRLGHQNILLISEAVIYNNCKKIILDETVDGDGQDLGLSQLEVAAVTLVSNMGEDGRLQDPGLFEGEPAGHEVGNFDGMGNGNSNDSGQVHQGLDIGRVFEESLQLVIDSSNLLEILLEVEFLKGRPVHEHESKVQLLVSHEDHQFSIAVIIILQILDYCRSSKNKPWELECSQVVGSTGTSFRQPQFPKSESDVGVH